MDTVVEQKWRQFLTDNNFKEFYLLTLIWGFFLNSEWGGGKSYLYIESQKSYRERCHLLSVTYCCVLYRGLCTRQPKIPLTRQNYPVSARRALACLSCRQTTQKPISGPVMPTCCFIHWERTGQNKGSRHCILWLQLSGCFNMWTYQMRASELPPEHEIATFTLFMSLSCDICIYTQIFLLFFFNAQSIGFKTQIVNNPFAWRG